MDASDKKLPVPPYVAYKTLKNFLDKFNQGLPGRIDRGLMSSMSGAAQSQVTTALRYLGMISENNIPTDVMRRYVTGEDSQRKEALREMLSRSYPFIFISDFDFSTATASQLREEFEAKTTATGETVGRCIAFLKDAALDADIVVSRFITQKKARTAGARRRPVVVRKDEGGGKEKSKDEYIPLAPLKHPTIAAQESLLLWGLFQRLPKPGSIWSIDDRKRWMETLGNVLELEYKES